MDLYVFFCLVFAMALCASVYMCLVVTCWERADLLALIRGVYLRVCHFPIGILGQVKYLIVSISDLCTLTDSYISPCSGLTDKISASAFIVRMSIKIMLWQDNVLSQAHLRPGCLYMGC